MGYFDVSTEEITKGSISKSLVLISVPLFFQSLVLISLQIIDLFWVGQYSSEAVAAIGLATPIVWLLIALSINGLYTGTKVLVSQRVGGEDQYRARRASFTGFLLSIPLGLTFGVLAFLTAEPLISLMTSTQPGDSGAEVQVMAVSYIKIISLGIFIAAMGDVTEASFIARGDSKATLAISSAIVVANIVLDPILIFGLGPFPSLGIEGAALATVAGYLAGLLLSSIFVIRGRAGGIYSWESVELSLDDAKEIIDIGAPVSVQSSAGNIGSLMMMIIVFAAAGTAGVTAYTIGSRFSSLALLSVQSLSSSALTIIGQNLGAGNPKRAATTVSTGIKIGFSMLVVIATFQWIFAENIARVFVPDISGETLILSVAFLQIFAIAYPAMSLITHVTAAFNGARRTKTTMVFSLLEKWILQIPMAIGLGLILSFGAIGVFWARSLSVVIGAVLFASYYIYTQRNGMYRSVVESPASTSSD